METEGKTLVTARTGLGGYPDPTPPPLAKATMKRLGREYGKPGQGVREAWAGSTGSLGREYGKPRKQAKAAVRALVDLALLPV